MTQKGIHNHRVSVSFVALSKTILLGMPRLAMNRLSAATIASDVSDETASK